MMHEKFASRKFRAIPAVTLLLVLLLVLEALPLSMTDARPKPHRGVETEVIGGTPVSQGNYRFMTFIEVPPGVCSGTLIAPNYVLTAAHCATEEFTGTKFAPEDFTLRIGRANVNDVDPETNLFGVSAVFVHPDYDADPQAFHDDIAVLKLDRAVPKSIAQPIRIVKLNQQNVTSAGKEGVVSGWGVTSNGFSSEQLMRATLTLSSSASCSAIFGADFEASTMLCAEYAGRAGCSGDSGGPLVVKAQIGAKKKKHKKGHKGKKKPVYGDVQAGVFTFGQACEDSAFMSLTAPEFNAFVVNAMKS